MSVRQTSQRMRTAGNIQLPHHLAVCIILLHTLVSIMSYEEMTVIQPPCITHECESAILHTFRQDAGFLHNLPFWGYLQHPSGNTFANESITIFQALAGKDRTL